MRKLRGGIPRALSSHRSASGAIYGSYCRAKVARLGSLPPDALPWLKESGLLVLALGRLHEENETARLMLNSAGRLARDKARVQLRQIERRAGRLRGQLASAEARLEELAKAPHGNDPLAALLRAGVGRR